MGDVTNAGRFFVTLNGEQRASCDNTLNGGGGGSNDGRLWGIHVGHTSL